MNFEKLLEHLKDYKIQKLKIPESGTFKSNGKLVKKDHILPKEKESKNLLDEGFHKDELKVYEELKKEKKLHRYFHHLNSSQAMAINFLEPLIQKDMLSYVLSNDKSKVCEEFFEYELHNDETFEKKPHTKTNFDFFIKTNSKRHFYEFKYTEASFGSAKKDEIHSQKYEKVYKPALKKVCKTIPEEKQFLNEYQLWRLFCHLQYGDVYIVLPGWREDLIRKINESKNNLKDDIKNSVHNVELEVLVNKLKQSKDAAVSKHYLEFEKKYLNVNK